MAQVVKLKRTSVAGRKPTTSNLELGELAINTFDGKIYFEKDNGTTSIEEIATHYSTLNGMTVSGSFSGSFQGDGSNLTGLTTEISEVATVTDTFTNATSKVVTHNFGTKNVIVTVYGNDDSYFIPNSIVTTNTNQVTVTFSGTESGRVVVAKGGHIVQGVAADDSTLLDGENAAYYLNYNNHTNTPTTITTDQANKITANDGKVGYTDALVKTKLNTETVISGSSQITDLTTHKETVSGASSYVVDHNLNEQYPIVQAWNTATSQQELPNSITTNSANRVTVTFSITFAGIIIVKK